jgi:hypothetical protein
MPKRDPDLLVEDMLGAIRKIARFTTLAADRRPAQPHRA